MKRLIPVILHFAFYILHFSSNAQRLYFSQANNVPVVVDTLVNVPLQNAWAGGINFPIWSAIDLNGDGLMDIYTYDRTNDRVLTFINDGTQSFDAFHFDLQYISKFPKVVAGGWAKCYDYNCDGKMDYITLDSISNGLAIYRNDYSTATGLRFTLVTPELKEAIGAATGQTLYATAVLIPTFIDVDDDGDMDILGFNSTPDGRIAYHKNYAMEHFGRCDTFDFKLETRCWGKFGLSFGSNNVAIFHDSCTTPGPAPIVKGDETGVTPASAGNGPYVAERDDTIATICALDLDGDGLKDLLVGDIASSNCLMIHNAGTLQLADMDTKDVNFPSYNQSINIIDFIFHSYLDADNDGKNDLIASAGQVKDKNAVWLYKNNGTNASPVFNFQRSDFLQGSMIELGEAAAPVMFDYDADGLKDLVIAYGVWSPTPSSGVYSKLALFKNVGTATTPSFKFITDDYADVGQYILTNPIYPAFGDIDCDGDEDLLIGAGNGKLYYFANTSGAGNPANFPSLTLPQYMGITAGGATPQIVDLNNDGLPDLVIGRNNGKVAYYQNTATNCASPFFSSTPTKDSLGNINVKTPGTPYGFSVPFIFKNNGQHEMMVSNMDGKIFYYNNIDNNLSGTFTVVDSFINGSLGARPFGLNLTVSGGDINGDTIPDMLIGLFSGGARIYFGSHTNTDIVEALEENIFECFPNPAIEMLNIRLLKRINGALTLKVFNTLGETVIDKHFTDSTISLETKNIPAGIYFIQISSSSKSYFQKVIICH